MKKDFLYIVAIIVLSVLYLNSCSNERDLRANEIQNEKALNDTIKYFENENGQEVAEKLAFKGTNKQLQDLLQKTEAENSQLRVALKGFKKVSSAAKVKTEASIDTVFIPFETKIPCDFERKFLKQDPFYTIAGSVNQLGVNFDNILIPNTQTLVTGRKKVGPFKTEFRFEVTNSNKYIKTTSIDSYNFVESQNRWGLSIIGGYVITSELKPTFAVGFGVSYDLIRF